MTDTNQTEELELVDEPKPNQELLAVERQLQSFSKTEAGLVDLEKRYGGVIYNCAEPKQLKLAREARGEIKKPRVNVEKLRKAAKAPLLDLGRDLDARAAVLKTRFIALEDPIDKQIKSFEQIEVIRLKEISGRIEEIGMFVDMANESQISSVEIGRYLNALTDLEINAELFAEFEVEALEKQNAAIGQVRSRFENAEQREKDAAELEELRRDKEKRDQDEADRKAQDIIDRAEAENATVEEVGPQTVEEALGVEDQLDISAESVAAFSDVVNAIDEAGIVDVDDFDNCVVIDEPAVTFEGGVKPFDAETINRSELAIANADLTPIKYPGLRTIVDLLCKEFAITVGDAETWIEKASDEVLPF